MKSAHLCFSTSTWLSQSVYMSVCWIAYPLLLRLSTIAYVIVHASLPGEMPSYFTWVLMTSTFFFSFDSGYGYSSCFYYFDSILLFLDYLFFIDYSFCGALYRKL
jgi:hypothetical protein